MTANLEEFSRIIDEAEWSWLRAHLERGGLIVVGSSLDLAEVAVKVADDDAGTIGEWIACERIGKPNLDQIKAWDADPAKRFRTLIVSPFVLIQDCAKM